MDFCIKYLQNSEIDYQRWDSAIFNACNGNPYAFSWYLDVVCENWDALIVDDYQTVFPLPFKKRWGLRVLYQPFFTQQLGIFSQHPLSNENQTQLLQAISKKFKIGRLQLNSQNVVNQQLFSCYQNVNHELNLQFDYSVLYSNYSENAKRNLKKAHKAGLKINVGQSFENAVSMFLKYKSPALPKMPDCFFQYFSRLFSELQLRNAVEIYDACTTDGNICASVILMKVHNRLVYLFSGCTPTAYENGAQFFLVDFIIQKYAEQPFIFDFEGSNNPNLARFYKGFGSERTTYPVVLFENFPTPIVKILQNMHKI